MLLTPKSCATCCSYSAAQGSCTSVDLMEKRATPQARYRSRSPDDSCKAHQSRLQSDARDLAVLAFWPRVRDRFGFTPPKKQAG